MQHLVDAKHLHALTPCRIISALTQGPATTKQSTAGRAMLPCLHDPTMLSAYNTLCGTHSCGRMLQLLMQRSDVNLLL
jgi:hypothetical protein